MNISYGLKEVANVIFFDVSTGKPVIFFDTLKVSTIENTSESAEARGGQGNGRLMSWDFGRTANLTMQDALLSDQSLSLLAGTSVKTENIQAVGREIKAVSGGAVALDETPIVDSVSVFKYQGGIMTDEITTITVADKDVTLTGATDGEEVIVFYEYIVTNAEATLVTFSANKFPATYRVVGDTVARGRDGVDRKMQFIIPRAKLQSGFTLTMDAENVSTFDFNLDVLVQEGQEQKLYDIIRL